MVLVGDNKQLDATPRSNKYDIKIANFNIFNHTGYEHFAIRQVNIILKYQRQCTNFSLECNSHVCRHIRWIKEFMRLVNLLI